MFITLSEMAELKFLLRKVVDTNWAWSQVANEKKQAELDLDNFLNRIERKEKCLPERVKDWKQHTELVR